MVHTKDLTADRVAYFEEDLELVHLTKGLQPLGGIEPYKNFLRGGQISWFELGLQADVERELTRDLLHVVQDDLEHRRCSRVNLYHEAGAGGSTVARRVLWTLCRHYPSIVLNRCIPRETAERVASLYQITGQPILILREGGDVPDTEAEHFANLLAGKQLPSVMLQCKDDLVLLLSALEAFFFEQL